MNTTARNATLADLAQLLLDQQAAKVDVVAPAAALRAEQGDLIIEGVDATLTADGVTTSDGRYVPTAVADEGIAGKLGIPLAYLRRMRTDRPDLYDANVNGWLAHDHRSFLVRCFRPDSPTEAGVARAFLSSSYRIIDNLDVLTAAMDGVRQSMVDVQVQACDLTERRMYVRIVCPQVRLWAPHLLGDYRSPFRDPAVRRAGQHDPFDGVGADGDPVVFAGLVISNSETGGGAFTITPRLVVQVCSNGMTVAKDALRNVHLGGKLDDGVVNWSDDTRDKNLALVTAQARDAVATFLDVDYMRRVVDDAAEQASVRLTDPQTTVEHVGRQLRFTAEQTAGVLDHFIRGGQITAGGVLQAVTSYAQTVADADEAADLEAAALPALTAAARA